MNPTEPNPPQTTPPVQVPSPSEDDLLQSASNDVAQTEDQPQMPPPEFKPKKGKKFLVFFLVLILLGGAAATGWYFFLREKPAEPVTEQTEQAEVVPQYQPVNIAYAYTDDTKTPLSLYARPVTGGDRTESDLTLSRKEYTYEPTVKGSSIAFTTSSDVVYVSTDSGTTYKKIYELEAGEEITSLMQNKDGTRLAMAKTDSTLTKNTVYTMDLDGQNVTEIFSTKKTASNGIWILGWNDSSFVYRTYRMNSEDSSMNVYVYDVEEKKSSDIIEVADGQQGSMVTVSDDLTKLIYSYGKTDPNPDGSGAAPLAPHTIAVIDIASGESTEIATVGKEGETNKNGTTIYRETQVGFLINSTTPYYVDQTKLNVVQDGTEEPTTLFESDNLLREILYVSEDNVIASSGKQGDEDFVVTNYSTESKEAATVLEGDVNTFLLGITTN